MCAGKAYLTCITIFPHEGVALWLPLIWREICLGSVRKSLKASPSHQLCVPYMRYSPAAKINGQDQENWSFFPFILALKNDNYRNITFIIIHAHRHIQASPVTRFILKTHVYTEVSNVCQLSTFHYFVHVVVIQEIGGFVPTSDALYFLGENRAHMPLHLH